MLFLESDLCGKVIVLQDAFEIKLGEVQGNRSSACHADKKGPSESLGHAPGSACNA